MVRIVLFACHSAMERVRIINDPSLFREFPLLTLCKSSLGPEYFFIAKIELEPGFESKWQLSHFEWK